MHIIQHFLCCFKSIILCLIFNYFTTSPKIVYPMNSLQKNFDGVFKDMKPKMSPLSVKSSKIQDTNFIISDTEEAVAKISALFPTVSETHIKLLLKK